MEAAWHGGRKWKDLTSITFTSVSINCNKKLEPFSDYVFANLGALNILYKAIHEDPEFKTELDMVFSSFKDFSCFNFGFCLKNLF